MQSGRVFNSPQLHQQSKSYVIIRHHKALILLELRLFLFPIRHYKTLFNPRILGVDLVGSFLTRENYTPKTLKPLANTGLNRSQFYTTKIRLYYYGTYY